MADPIFRQVQERFIDQLKDTPDEGGGGTLFHRDAVFQSGDHVGKTLFPFAEVAFGNQDSIEGETTTKITQRMGVDVKVTFAKASGVSKHVTHATAFRLVYNYMMGEDSKRTLGGKAITLNFEGGGTTLEPYDIDEDGNAWSFTMNFEVVFAHSVNDSTIQK